MQDSSEEFDCGSAPGGAAQLVKRALDLTLAGAGLLVLSPLMAFVAVAVRLNLGSPVLFRQVRPGYRMRPFELVKFRTMRDASSADGEPLPDRERLTALGRFLRRSSLDELPQLWNVVRGDVSLVGPRPLLMHYLPYFTVEERKRFCVLPGITGWAQIRGRNMLSWDDKLRDDVWYVEHWSLWLDCRILGRTVIQVLTGRDAVADPLVIMQSLDRERATLGPARCE
jgi:lipopolysaccharide/colanic/teichoic acid biosynthesis glycosyltransferase